MKLYWSEPSSCGLLQACRPIVLIYACLLSIIPFVEGFAPSSQPFLKLRPLSTMPPVQTRTRGTLSSILRAQDVTVTLARPLGIVFEEVEPGKPLGVVVAKLEKGGNADKDGRVLVGDKLMATSAVIFNSSNNALIGLGGGNAKTNWSREMIPVGKESFETIMGAIGSNTARWGYDDVKLTLRRTANSIPRGRDASQTVEASS